MSLEKLALKVAPLATVPPVQRAEALQLLGPKPVSDQVPVWAEAGRQGAMMASARAADDGLRKRLAIEDFMEVISEGRGLDAGRAAGAPVRAIRRRESLSGLSPCGGVEGE
jgi:hypothetical protein